MKVLIGCEESQTVCIEFRKLGHQAYSCDVQECSGGHSEWHLKMDIFEALKCGTLKLQNNDIIEIKKWHLGIFHPPCTYFSRAGLQFIHTQPDRKQKQAESFEFIKSIWECDIDYIAIENPVGWLNTNWKKPDQKFHPYYFGDREMKETCLWLKGLPILKHSINSSDIKYHRSVDKPIPISSRMGSDGKMKNKYFTSICTSAKARSKTFPGIAKAMAEQWG